MHDLEGFYGNVKERFQELAGLAQTEARCAAIVARREVGKGKRLQELLRNAADLPDRMMEVEVLLKDLEIAVHSKARH